MKAYKIFFMLVVLGVMSHCYANGVTRVDSVRIEMKSLKDKNQTIDFYGTLYVRICSITLDSNGIGTILVPIKRKQYASFVVKGIRGYIPVFLDSGYNFVFTNDNNHSYYSGKGAAVNNYLLKSHLLFNQYTDSIRTIQDFAGSINTFVRLSDHCESDQMELYKKYYDNIKPCKELDYLLKANIQSLVLSSKQNYLNNFTSNDIDSLRLVDRLGLSKNNLLEDTLFIQYPTFEFHSYLEHNLEIYIQQSGFIPRLQIEDRDDRIISMSQIIKSSKKYGKKIKIFLLFKTVFESLRADGPGHILDSIVNELYESGRITPVTLKTFTNEKEKLIYLMPGQPAPALQGISQDGKVYSLNEFKGKVIFVDIWATWCSPCMKALPHVQALQKKFARNKYVVFLFLSHDRETNDAAEWKDYLKAHPEFTGIQLLRRRKEDMSYEYKWIVIGIPRYILVDKQGKIIDAFAGNNSYEKIQTMIEKAMEK